MIARFEDRRVYRSVRAVIAQMVLPDGRLETEVLQTVIAAQDKVDEARWALRDVIEQAAKRALQR